MKTRLLRALSLVFLLGAAVGAQAQIPNVSGINFRGTLVTESSGVNPPSGSCPTDRVSRYTQSGVGIQWTCRSGTWQKQASSSYNTIDTSVSIDPSLASRIVAADFLLGSSPGEIVVTDPGTIDHMIELAPGHSLRITVPITFSAQVNMRGNNGVSCTSSYAVITANVSNGVNLVGYGSGFDVHGCTVVAGPVTVAGTGNGSPITNVGYLFTGAPASRVKMYDNTLTGVLLGDFDGGPTSPNNDLTFHNNTVTGTVTGGTAAIVVFYGVRMVVSDNRFYKVVFGLQYWGGDAGASPGRSQITYAGEISATGNVCTNVVACLWGSMGYQVTFANNTANGCADYCFGFEGSRDSVMSGNSATGGGNANYALEFSSFSNRISNNEGLGTSGQTNILIKNASQDVSNNIDSDVSDNTLTCYPTTCSALYMEATRDLRFDRNTIIDGYISPIGYGAAFYAVGNKWKATQNLGHSMLNIPSGLYGEWSRIIDNTFEVLTPQSAGTAPIALFGSDFNANDVFLIQKNTIIGNGFPYDWILANNSGNSGIYVTVRATDNLVGTKSVQVNVGPNKNFVYYNSNNCPLEGCAGASF